METVNITCRVDAKDVKFLDSLAQSMERDRSYLIKKALADYIENQRWHMEETKRAIKEADAGLFASDKEVADFFAPIKSLKRSKK